MKEFFIQKNKDYLNFCIIERSELFSVQNFFFHLKRLEDLMWFASYFFDSNKPQQYNINQKKILQYFIGTTKDFQLEIFCGLLLDSLTPTNVNNIISITEDILIFLLELHKIPDRKKYLDRYNFSSKLENCLFLQLKKITFLIFSFFNLILNLLLIFYLSYFNF